MDVLKGSDYLAEFTSEFTSVAPREVIYRDTLRRRLLLCLFALGTNLGIRAIVATGQHCESEAALRHVRRHFINRDSPRRTLAKLVRWRGCRRAQVWWAGLVRGPIVAAGDRGHHSRWCSAAAEADGQLGLELCLLGATGR